jgi:hypothetical protein
VSESSCVVNSERYSPGDISGILCTARVYLSNFFTVNRPNTVKC